MDFSRKMRLVRWKLFAVIQMKKGTCSGMSMLPSTVTEEMLMDWLATTMLLFPKKRTKDEFILISNLHEVSGPPSPFEVETPVPSPSYGKDDFDPTYEGSDLFARLQQ